MSSITTTDAANARPAPARSETIWEVAGTLAGLSCCVFIVLQIISEWRATQPSSLSMGYLGGFLGVFAFWTLYGLRFKRTAIWLTNGIAVVLQVLLIIASQTH